MPTKRDEQEALNDLLFRAPGLDEQDLLQRIRANSARRVPQPPVPAALGRARLADRRRQLRAAVKDLQDRVRVCGAVGSRRHGWRAAIEVFVKKSIRRLLLRHHLQQHRVHLKLVKVLNELVRYLDDADDCVRTCLDQADRRCEQTTEPPRPHPGQAEPSTPERSERRIALQPR